jgi:hypothetical protein
MKLAHANQAVTRQGRMDQLRRDRSTAQALRAAFPAVHQLRIELKFEGPFTNTPTAQCHVLYPPARAFFGYPCPYADCDGHFDLGEAVKAALADESNVSAGALECHGSRARDHASKQPCLLQILYEVTATYHEKT